VRNENGMHLAEDFYIAEIVNPDTDEPVAMEKSAN
jgi:phenylacetate-coenzyme A ligase PaaK-like adenylate-forming protein